MSILLLLSLVTLLAGPLVYRLAHNNRNTLATLDGFIVIAIGGLTALAILPNATNDQASAHSGWMILLLIAGLFGPNLIESLLDKLALKHAAQQAHILTLILGLSGLVLHTLLDGATLATTQTQELPLAIILHRLPAALAVWWLVTPKFGGVIASGVLLLMAACTLIGYFGSSQLPSLEEAELLHALEAFVAGTLLHVVFFRPHLDGHHQHSHSPIWAEGVGNALGFLLLASVIYSADHAVPNALKTLWHLTVESAPALLLAYGMGGLLSVFMPQSSVNWLKRGGAFSQATRGMAIGLPLPVCSCGVVPLYRSLIERGAPTTAAMAFLIATPELGLDAILLSLPLLGVDMTITRILAAAAVALLVGWLVGKWATAATPAPKTPCCHSDNPDSAPPTTGAKLRSSFQQGYGELVDATAPWIVFGLMIAAVAQPLLASEALRALPDWAEVLIFALLGMPIYVCAAGATPIMAVLIAAGISPGAAIAFLLTGPATNIATFGVLSQLHDRKTAIGFGVATGILAIISGWVINQIAGDFTLISAEALANHHTRWWQWVCVILLCVAFGYALLKQGARQFFGGLFALKPHTH